MKGLTMPSPGVFGYAMYFEFLKDGNTFQHYWTTALNLAGTKVHAINWSRNISAREPQKSWRRRVIYTTWPLLSAKGEASPPKAGDMGSPLVKHMDESLHQFLQNSGYKLENKPVVVELTWADGENINAGTTPEALHRRIMAARLEAGYPPAVWEDRKFDPTHESTMAREYPTKPPISYPPMATLFDSNVDTHIRELVHSTDFPAIDDSILDAIYAMGLSSVSPQYEGSLKNLISPKGSPRGRSLAGAPTESQEVSVEETGSSADHYIRPNGEKYFHRPWGEKHRDVEVLRSARSKNLYTLLYGPPGTGKSALSEAAFGEDLLTIIGTGDTEVSDFVGGYVMNAEGGFDWSNGPLLTAMLEGRPLLIDEIGVIDTKALVVLYGTMDGRRELTVTANPALGTVKAKDGFFIIAATNPDAPGVVLSEALTSRFLIQTEITTDYVMARSVGVDNRIVSAAKNLDAKVRSGQAEWAPQFRELLAYREISKTFGEDFAIANLIAAAPPAARDSLIDILSRGLGRDVRAAQIR